MRRWKSFERLTHLLYKYAVVVCYNDNPMAKGKESAIFLHIWPPLPVIHLAASR